VKPLVLGLCLLLLVACTGVTRRQATPSASRTSSRAVTGTTPAILGQPGCRPPSPISRTTGFPEIEGTSDQLRMWGLIMAQRPHEPLQVNEDVKIVWRITGSGALHLDTFDPAGRPHPLQWGPDPHLSSTYRRPGDEWGAGYRFTQPGCWTVRAARGSASASVWLEIAA
jgi:hypothetical protein